MAVDAMPTADRTTKEAAMRLRSVEVFMLRMNIKLRANVESPLPSGLGRQGSRLSLSCRSHFATAASISPQHDIESTRRRQNVEDLAVYDISCAVDACRYVAFRARGEG